MPQQATSSEMTRQHQKRVPCPSTGPCKSLACPPKLHRAGDPLAVSNHPLHPASTQERQGGTAATTNAMGKGWKTKGREKTALGN